MFRRFASHAAGQQPEAPAFVYRSASSKITSCVSSPFDWTIRDPNWIIKLALTSFMFRRFASHAAGQQPEAPAFVYRSASSKITSCVSSPFDWTIRDPNWIIKLALPPLPTRAGGRAQSPAATEHAIKTHALCRRETKKESKTEILARTVGLKRASASATPNS